jgi:hypothetical protein
MKCLSCESEINPKWTFAISENICPMCGKPILEEHLKNLLASLRETMDAMAAYPDQLNDWMLSNHSYIKTDAENLVDYVPKDLLKGLKKADDEDFQKRKESQKFTVKVKTDNGEEDVEAETIQSQETTNDFFKRAEVIKKNTNPSQGGSFQSPAEKTSHLKKVMQQIKRAGSTGLSNSEGGEISIPAHMMEDADPEAIADYESLLSSGEIRSSLSESNDDDIPASVLAMASRANPSGKSNNADLIKLQQMQDRVRKSREAFESGENRGSKGGGFSRA